MALLLLLFIMVPVVSHDVSILFFWKVQFDCEKSYLIDSIFFENFRMTQKLIKII